MSGGRTNIGGVEIDVRADGTLLIADLKRAEAQAIAFANRASGAAKKVKSDGFDPLGRAVGDVRTQMLQLASIGALAGLTSQAIKAADAFTGMRSRLSLVVSEGENLLQVEESLAQLALKNRADLGATVSLYSRLRTARKDLDDATTTQILDAWSKTLVISGANATEAASATLQFAQAMGSGRLQGAELTAVLENNSRASRLIAEGMGVSIGALKKLGEQGDLTTDKLIEIFTNAGALDAEFGKMAMTVGQAGTNFETAFTRLVGLLDQSTGITRTLAGWIDSLANSMIDLAVSFGGPIAEADALIKKTGEAQNQIIDDGETLKQLYIDLAGAIAMGGEEAGDAARLEIDAISQRIRANQELIGVYSSLAEAKMIAAEAELATRKGDPTRELYSDRNFGLPGLDDRLLNVPLNDKGETIAKTFGLPAQTRGRDGEVNQRFGTRDQRVDAAIEQIRKTDPAKLSDAQRALLEYYRQTQELEAKAKTTRLEFEALSKAIVEGAKYVPASAKQDGAPKAVAGGDEKEKADKLRKYTTAIEDFNAAIATAAGAKADDADKSRAATQALLDYYAVTQDIEDTLMRIQALTAAGLLSPDDAEIVADLARLNEFQNTDFGLETDDASTSLAPTYDPTLPEGDKDQRDYFEGYAENIRNATSYALSQAMLTGDWGKHFGDVLEGAANDAFSRAVDKLTDALFDALAQIDWGEIFGGGEGGVGGLLNSVFAAFGGARAGGGDMRGGTAYRVGELGPEMFVPATDGYMIPNKVGSVVGSPGAGGGASVSVGGTSIVINGNADSVTVRDLENVLEHHRRTLPDLIDQRVYNRMMKGAF